MVKVDLTDYMPKDVYVLSVREVGSRMWGMADVSSDHDLYVVYADATSNILKGRRVLRSLPCKHHVTINDRLYDFQYVEIGHVCDLLKKGNVNTIWGTISPLVYYQHPMFVDLSLLIEDNPAKAIVPSGRGMADSQLNRAGRRLAENVEKNIITAIRTCKFVINALSTDSYGFDKVLETYTRDDAQQYIDSLDGYLERSVINDDMPIQDIEEWLMDFRIAMLNNELYE